MNFRLSPAIVLLFVAVDAAALANGFFLEYLGRKVRPEHLIAVVACGLFAIGQLARQRRVFRLDAYSLLALAWVGVNAMSSWLYAPQPVASRVHVVRLGLLAATFVLVANLPLRRADAWSGIVRVWVALTVASLAYGIAIWVFARYANVWVPGVAQEANLSGLSVSGLQLERNLYGILAATLLAFAFYSIVAERLRPGSAVLSRSALVCTGVVAAIALVLSLTRSAWLAVAIVAPIAYALFDRRRPSQIDRALLMTGAGLPLILGVLIVLMKTLPAPSVSRSGVDSGGADRLTTVLSVPVTRPSGPASVAAPAAQAETPSRPTAASGVGDRLSTFGNLRSDFTVSVRMQDAQWAISDWLKSPLLGHGTGAFLQIHGMRVGTEAWVSNLPLHTMVDTGLMGLIIQLALFTLVAVRTWQAAQVARDPRLAAGLRALTLGFLVMAVAYQVTDGTWLAVFWIHLGLMVNGIYCVAREPREAAAIAPFPAARTT